jgi:uncharacterized protein (UPF0179 family)
VSEIKDVELAERLPELEEDHTYRIEKVEFVNTPVQGLEGWRVTAVDVANNSVHGTMLWKRQRVGPFSKLGTFIKAFKAFFGNEESARNTDLWIGKTILVISWMAKNREIKVVEASTPESIEACTRQIGEKLEHGKAYTLSDVKAAGVDFPENVIEEALKKLEGLGKAYALPTKPAKWFIEG